MKSIICLAILLLLVLATVVGIYHTHKTLPDGIAFAGPTRLATDVRFLRDLTYVADGERRVEQEIFDAVFDMIDRAERLVLVDMFLFNEFQGSRPETTRELARELTDRLVERINAKPGIQVFLLTDPINTVYGGMVSPQLQRLRAAGAHVTITDLSRLRDSNALYSAFWRLLVKPFGNSEGGLFPNPFGSGRVGLRSYLALANFKANHRKVVVTDSPTGLVGLVTSANPHDGSSAHGNVALQFTGAAVQDLLAAEGAVMRFSGGPYQLLAQVQEPDSLKEEVGDALQMRVVSEQQIEQVALELIGRASAIDLAMFYLSDRELVTALKAAAYAGVPVRLILDPNKDAFGHAKGGIPNRQVAAELLQTPGIRLRWAATNGEQFHSKMLLTRDDKGNASLMLGSANFTRRNLGGFNLELDAVVWGVDSDPVFRRASAYFERAWHNEGGQIFTTEYDTYSQPSLLKNIIYRFMEFSGMSSF
jgi:phosphatidylserine/phosphatidylglycerophosphate/cardiolipin synthase-like enzyme